MRLLSLIWNTLWLAWLTFVLFVLTYPLNKFDGQPHWRNIRWMPFRELTLSSADVFETSANVLIFIPLGYLTVRAWRSRTSHPVLMAGVLSVFCSASAELFQLFCHDRVPATTDLITNTTGGVIGACVALLLSWRTAGRSVMGDAHKPEAGAVRG
jgi:glycopeptide antibiotics resistance protein